MLSLISIIYIATFFGCIPYLIWATRTAIKKNWRKLGYQIAIPTIFYTVFFLSQDWLNERSYNDYLKNIYGGETALSDPIFSKDSERSFQGDGTSITVYELNDEVKQRFLTPSTEFLAKYPLKPSYRSKWQTKKWRRAPYEESEEKYISFGLLAANSQKQALKEALKRSSTYYAYFHYDHGDNPGNIDLYVIDLLENKIYSINLNT